MVSVNEAVDIVNAVCKARSHVHTELQADVVNFLLKTQERFSPVVGLNKVSIEELWATVRENDTVAHFLLNATSEFKARAEFTIKDWNTFCKILGASIALKPEDHFDPPVKFCKAFHCYDDSLLANVEPIDTIVSILVANPWLVFIVLMTFCPSFYNGAIVS